MKKTIQAWKEAAVDLGIEIDTPFYLRGDKFPLFVRYFGSEIGTIVLQMEDIDSADNLIPNEYYRSRLNPEFYSKYERELFIDTLEDWGWFGPEVKRPSWYMGKYFQKGD